MITCNILYEFDSELPQVIKLRKILDEVHRKQFFFTSRTYKHKPVKKKELGE